VKSNKEWLSIKGLRVSLTGTKWSQKFSELYKQFIMIQYNGTRTRDISLSRSATNRFAIWFKDGAVVTVVTNIMMHKTRSTSSQLCLKTNGIFYFNAKTVEDLIRIFVCNYRQHSVLLFPLQYIGAGRHRERAWSTVTPLPYEDASSRDAPRPLDLSQPLCKYQTVTFGIAL
jgi:hypothetical protein